MNLPPSVIVTFLTIFFPQIIHSTPNNELIQGACSEARDADMVYHEIVEKDPIPLITRNATSMWYGDEELFCIKVINEYRKRVGKGGGTAFVKHGGLGHHFVSVEMHSEKGGSMAFLIFLYGRKRNKL